MEIVIIIALILLNGVFAMSEIALISARKSSLNNDVRHGSSTARIALKLANDRISFIDHTNRNYSDWYSHRYLFRRCIGV